MKLKKFVFLWVYLIFQFGQPNSILAQKPVAGQDPKAKAVLDKLKKKFEGYKTIDAAFTMTIQLPEQKAEIQKGKMVQAGQKYRAEVNGQSVFCDGKTIWVFIKKNNEVQINNFEEGNEQGFMSPSQMLSMYQSKNYQYSIVGERKVGNKTFQDIEFKPTKQNSEIVKVRLSIDKSAQNPSSLSIFNRDGSRYIMEINSMLTNKVYPANHFIFNAKDFPGVKVEDLRI
jgi:outer membrane lipoprotein carrier protein